MTDAPAATMSESPTPSQAPAVETPTPEAAASPVITPPSTEASPLGGEGATQSPQEPGAGGETIAGASESTPVEYNLTFPDGVTPDADALAQFKTFAQEGGLSNEQAQKLVDMYVGQTTATQTALRESIAAEQTAAWTTMIDGWKGELAADPAYSGEKLAEAQVALGRALDEYGSPEARQAFDLTGAGWNPHVIRFIHRMASALQEGGAPVVGQPSRRGPQTPGQALYGNPSDQG